MYIVLMFINFLISYVFSSFLYSDFLISPNGSRGSDVIVLFTNVEFVLS